MTEQLKNALLIFLLISENPTDVDKSFEYGKYTGSKLPPLSGSSLEQALLSYISDPAFQSDASDKKAIAINKYLKKHLNTEKKVLKLLTSFIKKHSKD